MAEYLPKWHKELDIFRKIKPILIMEGNILDKYVYPLEGSTPKGSIVSLVEYLHYYFKDLGYQNIVVYDEIRGFHNPCEDGYLERFARLVGAHAANGSIETEFAGKKGTAAVYMEAALSQSETPTVILMDFASRYITDPANLRQPEVEGFTILQQASLSAAEAYTEASVSLKNLAILLVNKLNDLPAWFYLTNPNVKAITLTSPSREERAQTVCGERFRNYFDPAVFRDEIGSFEESELEKLQERFIGLTEGFTFTELNGLRKLSRDQKTHIRDLCNVVDLYKFGIRENPWEHLNLDNAYADFEKRVKGQTNALTQTLDVVKRAVTGMSGITSSTHGKPKGVLFFAGPTGTGKTETAKTLAEKIFGDESACIRFDMSEFSQSHSDQRLLGAPPGYVGYESGGQLTNAVKNNPFCILLFDEIEKAHPSILDKFLQILEDGRMTDGKGETVYFSECIIIFTSNLGIYSQGADGRRVRAVDSTMPYPEVQTAVRKGIEDYFKLQLGRPEILNRIGENIVVFDFIREETAERILRSQVDRIVSNLRSAKNIELELSERAFETLKQKSLGNLDNGGRGIGNIVESLLVNPLSRYMFDSGKLKNCRIRVENIQADHMPYMLTCSE